MENIENKLKRAAKDYNGKYMSAAKVTMVSFELTEDESFSVYTLDNEKMLISSSKELSPTKTKVGVVEVTPERVDLYPNLSGIMVIGLTAICAHDATSKIIMESSDEVNDMSLRNPSHYGTEIVDQLSNKIESLLADIIEPHIIVLPDMFAFTVPFFDDKLVVRINPTQYTLTVEYDEYMFGIMDVGDMSVVDICNHVIDLLPRLKGMVKNNYKNIPIAEIRAMQNVFGKLKDKAVLVSVDAPVSTTIQ